MGFAVINSKSNRFATKIFTKFETAEKHCREINKMNNTNVYKNIYKVIQIEKF